MPLRFTKFKATFMLMKQMKKRMDISGPLQFNSIFWSWLTSHRIPGDFAAYN